MRILSGKLWILVGIWILVAGILRGQSLIKDEPTKVDVLVFEHLQRGDLRFIRHGGHLQYALQSAPKRKYSGILERIDGDSITVGGNTVALRDMAYIKGKVRSERDIFGGVLVGVGVTTTALGTVFISSYAGMGIVGGGLAALALGIHFVTAKRKFDFNKGWQAYGGTIEYTR